MDPAPPPAEPAASGRIDLVHEDDRWLVPQVPAPVLAASLGDRVHLLAPDESPGAAKHVALSPHGEPSSPTRVPDLRLVPGPVLVPCRGGLAVVGAAPDEDRPVLVTVDANGVVTGRQEFSPMATPTVWPRPACAGDDLSLVWTTQVGDDTVLWTMAAPEGAPGVPQSVTLAGPTWELQAIGAAGGLTLVRTHGDALALELLRIVDGRLEGQEVVPDGAQAVSPTIALVGDGYAVLWIAKADGALRLGRFDRALRLVAPPVTLDTVSGTTRFYSATLSQGDLGRLAVRYVTESVGDEWIAVPQGGAEPDRYVPARTFRQYVAAVDARVTTPGPVHELPDPGIVYDAAAWVGDRWLLIHGSAVPRLTIFRAEERP